MSMTSEDWTRVMHVMSMIPPPVGKGLTRIAMAKSCDALSPPIALVHAWLMD